MSCNTAFLAVALDDALKTALYETACAIAASPEELLGVEDVGFKPHEEDKLHMTFVFCDEALHKLSKADLVKVHGEIQELATATVSDAHLTFKGLELFPPEKMNLIIAHFETPGLLQELRTAAWRICLKYGVALKDDEEWMAHVTLGKLRATKAQVGRVSCRSIASPAFAAGSLKPLGLTLLGARPKQVWLDWEEALLFAAAEDGPTATVENGATVTDCELCEATAKVCDAVDLLWLNSALCEEVSSTDAESLCAAVEVILGPEVGAGDFEEAFSAAVEVLRDGGAPMCADALRDHCRILGT
mmetsp:Transcript_5699/g.10202  ORF Transcript_5699/g.10202 Transcript_5699/m.10202 type:complete len:302 (+) Transcript_5699:1-906(+)